MRLDIRLRGAKLTIAMAALMIGIALNPDPPQAAAADDDSTIVDLVSQTGINVVITVSDMEKAQAFYGGVMGLTPMAPIAFSDKSNPVFFPEATTMVRYQVGSSEVKLLTSSKELKRHPGGIGAGIGFRMLAFPLDDADAFMKRVADAGLAEPRVSSMGPYRFGLLRDPDDNEVEFYYYEGGAPEGGMTGLQIALTVADAEKSSEFYGGLLGLPSTPPVAMPGRPGTMVHLFRLGETTVKFWSFGGELPVYSGRHFDAYGFRYLQYPVKDIEAAHEYMKARGATIELPPTSMESMPVKLMFVADPDGIINEFFGVGR